MSMFETIQMRVLPFAFYVHQPDSFKERYYQDARRQLRPLLSILIDR